MSRVYVGMSGGVDSSVTAALLKDEGYNVTGVFMKNWTTDLPGMRCPWADDLADAKRVAVQLGIDFKVFDFEADYREKVVSYMIAEYEAGRTPNPDIMCNQEVKFKLFLETALEDGAEMIATGHYARVNHDALAGPAEWSAPTFHSLPADAKVGAAPPSVTRGSTGVLKKAMDDNKDQTYFLYRVSGEALAKTLFPLGELTKPDVRRIAKEKGLFTAEKKDSQGICFVGQISVRDFLSQYLTTEPGDIFDKQSGEVVGRHDGALFYTLGQRHGLSLGGGLPYYVVGKDMEKNEVYVTRSLNDGALWKEDIALSGLHWIGTAPAEGEYDIRIRHRAPLVKASLTFEGDDARLVMVEPQRAVAPGQSVVLYTGDMCLGGGIVTELS